jgi:tetrahydromethanopterin S-methyltransferase subunit G
LDHELSNKDAEITEAKVTYTTKELLQRIDDRFDRLEHIAESAASRTDMEKVIVRVDKLERDSEGTKAVAKALLLDGKDRWSRNEKIAGLLVAIVALAPSVTTLVHILAHTQN